MTTVSLGAWTGLLFAEGQEGVVPLELTSNDLRIVSPLDGTTVEPGQTVPVRVEVAQGKRFMAVSVVGENLGITPPKAAPPYEFFLVIPGGVTGKRKLTAMGITAPEQGVFSPSVTLDVEPVEMGQKMTMLSTDLSQLIFEQAGEQLPLNVSGTTRDGKLVTLTGSTHLHFRTDNPEVATVDAQGWVTATGQGTAIILVSHGPQILKVPVTVQSSNNPPVINVRGNTQGSAVVLPTVRVGTPVTLNGKQSHDPDGDLLAFTWVLFTKPDGSHAVIRDQNQAVAIITPDMSGSYLINLVVDDGHGGVQQQLVGLEVGRGD